MTDLFNPKQFRILSAEGLRLFLFGGRGAAARSAERDDSKHIIGAAFSLALSSVVALLLFRTASPEQFLLAAFTLSMIFYATTVISELADGLFHPFDLAVTGHLPISGFTRFVSRFSELVILLGLLTFNLNLCPAIFFLFMTETSLLAVPLLLVSGFAASVFTASLCLVLYALLTRILGRLRLRGFLIHINMLITLGVLALMINIGPLLHSDALNATTEGEWPILFPPAWFACLSLDMLGLQEGGSTASILGALALAVALIPLFLAAMGAEGFLRGLAGSSAARGGHSAPGLPMRLFERLFVGLSEKAAFQFTAINLGRDKGFRMKTYPILGIPVLMISMSFFEEKQPLFFIFMLHLVNIYLPLVLSFLQFGDHFRASWIFDSLPLTGPKHFLRGAEKAFIYRTVLPLFLINTCVLAFLWHPLEGVLNAAYALLAGLFIVGDKFRKMNRYPFSMRFKGVSTEELFGSGFSAFLVFGVLVVVHVTLYESPVLLAGALVVLGSIHAVRFFSLSRPPREDEEFKVTRHFQAEDCGVTGNGSKTGSISRLIKAYIFLYLLFMVLAAISGYCSG